MSYLDKQMEERDVVHTLVHSLGCPWYKEVNTNIIYLLVNSLRYLGHFYLIKLLIEYLNKLICS